MAGPVITKFNLWTDDNKGIKSRQNAKKPVIKRPDVSQQSVKESIDRGGRMQKARLRHYPSIDVDFTKLYAGEIEGSVSDTEDKLTKIGFRNNPTAYVEVTKEYGPDEGSYSKQIITETGSRLDIPVVFGTPSFYRRVKDQVHVTLQKTGSNTVALLAHREQSAWLEPMRHVFHNDASARRGVTDFRNEWYFKTGSKLGGEEKVKWPTVY